MFIYIYIVDLIKLVFLHIFLYFIHKQLYLFYINLYYKQFFLYTFTLKGDQKTIIVQIIKSNN